MSAIKNTVTAAVISAALVLVPGLLKDIEGVRYKPYRDIAGIWTVCSGITGDDVILGKTYTQKECDALLYKHIAVAQKAVDRLVTYPIPDTMRAALYSFVFNVGVGAFSKSTLLKDINAGRLNKACDCLYDWVYFRNPKTGKKEVSRGLKNRRDVEFAYCVKEL